MSTTEPPYWARTRESMLGRWLKCCRETNRGIGFFRPLAPPVRLYQLSMLTACRLTGEIPGHIVDRLEDAESRCWHVEQEVRHEAELFISTVPASKGGSGEWTKNILQLVLSREIFHRYIQVGNVSNMLRLAIGERADALQGRHLLNVFDPGWEPCPSWRTSAAVGMARHVYDNRDWGQMPVLADALEEAGCRYDELLARMRDPDQSWSRGCRVVDELLGLRDRHES